MTEAIQQAAPVLALQNVSKFFGTVIALRDVSIAAKAGEVLCLLGDNGAGKSTLVKIISGGLQPTSGRMLFEGKEFEAKTPAEAKAAGIETVYQDLSLCTNVDVVANFFMGREIVRKVAGIPFLDERAMETVVEKALANAGTRIPSLRTKVEHLSGGQRQAIELNRFVHWGGKLVLLDEPFAALDAALRGSLRAEVRSALATAGATALLVTHDQDEALSMADSVAVLQGGRIALHDSPVRVYEAPTDLSAARFLGELVELPADLVAGRARCALGDVEVAVASGVDEGPVVLGLRPEQLRLGVPGLPGVGGTAGIIRAREYFGHDCLLGIELPDGSVVRARVAGRPPLADEVQVYVVGPVRAYAR